MPKSLLSQTIHLASANKDLRPYLLDVLRVASNTVKEVKDWTLTWNPSRPDRILLDHADWSDEAIQYRNGDVAYDSPEHIPTEIKAAVVKMFKSVKRQASYSQDYTTWSFGDLEDEIANIQKADPGDLKASQEGYNVIEGMAPSKWDSLSKAQRKEFLEAPISRKLEVLFNMMDRQNDTRDAISDIFVRHGENKLPPITISKGSAGGLTISKGGKSLPLRIYRDLYKLNDFLNEPEAADQLAKILKSLEEELKQR